MAERLAGIAASQTLATPLTCAPSSPAGGLIPDLEALGVEVRRANMTDVSQACTSFLDAVTAGGFVHTGQPQLAAQATAARQQVSGDSWRWTRKGIDDISGFYAVTLARWAYMTREEPTDPGAPSAFFFESLECQDCDCPHHLDPGVKCDACQHFHDDPELEDE
jgi:hypothetical protein